MHTCPDDVADGLEGEERYSYRKEDRIHAECVVPCDKVAGDCEIILHLESGPEEVVDHVGQEVCVLVIEQQRQIDRNPQEQHQTLPKPPLAMRQEPAGQVVGEHVHENDLVVNVTKAKQLTNVRASGTDEKARIIPPIQLSLEEALEYIKEDEYVEVTPKSMRIRKIILDHLERKRMNKNEQ